MARARLLKLDDSADMRASVPLLEGDRTASALVTSLPLLARVVAGGQTGVDQAALRAASDAGLEIGGWCPPGRRCENGTIPEDLPLRATARQRSASAPDTPRSQRTAWNVRDSDGTLVVCPESAAKDVGTDFAAEHARALGRALLIVDPRAPQAAATIRRWILAERVRTLNVAGPSEASVDGIGDRVYELLRALFGDRSA